MSAREPLSISLDQFKPGYTLRQIYREEDALEFVKEIQANAEYIEEYDWVDTDDYDSLLTLHNQDMSILTPGDEVHFGIWDGDICKGGISLLPDAHEGETEIRFWVDKLATGDGVACAALNGLVSHLWKKGKLAHFNIIADVDAENEKALKTLRNAYFIETFHQDGVIRFVPILSADKKSIQNSRKEIISTELLHLALEVAEAEEAFHVYMGEEKSPSRINVTAHPEENTVDIEVFEPVDAMEFAGSNGKSVIIDRSQKHSFVMRHFCKLNQSDASILEFNIKMLVKDRKTGFPEKGALAVPEAGTTSKSTNTSSTKKKIVQIKKPKKKITDQFLTTTLIEDFEKRINPEVALRREHLDFFLNALQIVQQEHFD